MNRKQKIIVSVTGIFIVLLILVGLTYAYFLTNIRGNTNTKSVEVTTANLILQYEDGNGIIPTDPNLKIVPGMEIGTKTFTVTNNGNATIYNYAVYLEDVINFFDRPQDLVYTLTCTSSDANTCDGKSETQYPVTNDILVINSIRVGVTHSYELTVTYKEAGVDQSDDMNKTIKGKVQIYNMRDIVDVIGTVTGANNGDYVELQSNPKRSEIVNNEYKITGVNPGVHTLYVKDRDGNTRGSTTITVNKSGSNSVEGNTINIDDTIRTVSIDIETIQANLVVDSSINFAELRENALEDFRILGAEADGITKIVFTNNLDHTNGDILSDGETRYKVISSEESTEPIYAWKKSGTLYIGVEKGVIYAPENSSGLFSDYYGLTEIKFNNIFNTSNVTNMSNIFLRLYSIATLDLSSFDTSKVTNMSNMFSENNDLQSLDLSSFDTSKVTNMSGMFFHNFILQSLNLSNFNTSNVTNMSSMFASLCLSGYCSSKVDMLDLTNFDTSKVTNMSEMFSYSSIDTLSLTSFDTSNVTNMSGMFSYSNIDDLSLINFDTSKVTNMSDMFTFSHIEDSLDLSGFDTRNVTNMESMFSAISIPNLDLSGLNMSNVTNVSYMFSGLNTETLDLSNVDMSNVTNVSVMFYDSNITTLDLSNIDISSLTDMSSMFQRANITNLNLTNFDTRNVTDMSNMFYSSGITNLDLSSFDTSKVTNMNGMFENSTITTLDLSSFDTSNVTDMSEMFDFSTITNVYVKDQIELNRFRTMSGIENPSIISVSS